MSKTTIGWSEFIDLPLWGINNLDAKIDTGARTSALHVENLEMLPDGLVGFDVILCLKNPKRTVHVVAPLLKRARVRSSTGRYTIRCFVKTRIRLGGIEKEIEISLISREKMVFRMLIGRQALKKHFIVDVSKRHVLRKPEQRKSKSL
jgi:hypothetical protein